MRKVIPQWLSIAALSTLGVACTTPPLTTARVPSDRLAYLRSDDSVAPHSYAFRDGARAIYFEWSIDAAEQARASSRRFDVFVIAGSGCTSMKYFFPTYFSGINLPARFLALQKRGISAESWGDGGECPKDFIALDHPSRTLADQIEFIERTRSTAPDTAMIVVGISEGAEIAVQVAQAIPSVSAVVLIAHAGVAPLTLYEILVDKHTMPATLLNAVGSRSMQDTEIVEGRSVQYWRETFALRTDDVLLSLAAPVWIAVGESDNLMPIEAVNSMEQRIAAHPGKSIRMVRYPGADHALCNAAECYRRTFFSALSKQLRSGTVEGEGK